ncbi:C39 family peptidase [Candidatus Stoquefichus massiliensis]|uniref:C39 family peptidase n=1 Tax=Candidatus Stoquefichus massiliensis TaxID=1470350 RepID=UPI0004B364D1|nr:C39 family peptidase [Candidatus Stoquefichus massiliensis]
MNKFKSVIGIIICISLFGCTTDECVQNSQYEDESILNQQLILDNKQIDVECILQNPQLPTGCEITSLTMVLNYHGFSINKIDLAENYLKKGKIGQTDFEKAFVGDPKDQHSYGCYAPVIVDCANQYLKEKKVSLKAIDYTGSSIEELYHFINQGIPVIVWATINMAEPYPSIKWTVDGNELQWISKEHCLVLTGYDKIENVVYLSDPLKGNIGYDATIFAKRYEQMFSQAIIIK